MQVQCRSECSCFSCTLFNPTALFGQIKAQAGQSLYLYCSQGTQAKVFVCHRAPQWLLGLLTIRTWILLCTSKHSFNARRSVNDLSLSWVCSVHISGLWELRQYEHDYPPHKGKTFRFGKWEAINMCKYQIHICHFYPYMPLKRKLRLTWLKMLLTCHSFALMCNTVPASLSLKHISIKTRWIRRKQYS